jgi:hypothetical protein
MVLDALTAAEQEDTVMTDPTAVPPPVLCAACGKPCELVPPSEMTPPREADEPPAPIRFALHESCAQPGVASMIAMERMARAGLLWPREEDGQG